MNYSIRHIRRLHDDALNLRENFTEVNDLGLALHTEVERTESLLTFGLGGVVGNLNLTPLAILCVGVVNHTLYAGKTVEGEGYGCGRINTYGRSLPPIEQVAIIDILDGVATVRGLGCSACISNYSSSYCKHVN